MNERRDDDVDPKILQRIAVLSATVEKKEKVYKTIYLSVVLFLMSALMLAVLIIFFPSGGDGAVRPISVMMVLMLIFYMIFYATRDEAVYALSRSLREMRHELNVLIGQAYPNIFRDHGDDEDDPEDDHEEDDEDGPYDGGGNRIGREPKYIAPAVERDPSDRKGTAAGVILLALSVAVFLSSFIDGLSDTAFGLIFIGGSWLFVYSCFLLYSRNFVKSAYYPTMIWASIFMPTAIALALTGGMPEEEQDAYAYAAMAFGFVLSLAFLYLSRYIPRRRDRKFAEENERSFETRRSEYPDVMSEVVNKKKDRALILYPRNAGHHVVIEKCVSVDPLRFERRKRFKRLNYNDAHNAAARKIVTMYAEKDGRPESELERRDRKLVSEYLKKMYEELQENDRLRGKISVDDEWITVRFHKYLEVRINGEAYFFLGMHEHYYDKEELSEFLDALIYEGIIFYQNSRTGRSKIYPRSSLEELMIRKNRKNCRVFSARMIYVDR